MTQTPTVPPFCMPLVGNPLNVNVPFSIVKGTASCGGDVPVQAPFSGAVKDGAGNALQQLGLGCLYAGSLPGVSIPDGSTALLKATGINGTTVTLGASDGNGPGDCTRGAGPGQVCVNGSPGTDGHGTCASDADCGAGGACSPTPNCYFGPPIPVPNDSLSSCVVNSFLADLCGTVDLTSRNTTMATALQSTVYLTGDPIAPCPVCTAGTCSSGKSAGLPCTAIGSQGTSPDCLPEGRFYITKLIAVFPDLTTGTSSLANPDGFFCGGQSMAGAFGFADARSVEQTGIPIGGGGTDVTSTALVAVFCIPSTGNPLIDFAGSFPTVGAFSAAGKIDLTQLVPLLPPLPGLP